MVVSSASLMSHKEGNSDAIYIAASDSPAPSPSHEHMTSILQEIIIKGAAKVEKEIDSELKSKVFKDKRRNKR